jgi:hypothetical protein
MSASSSSSSSTTLSDGVGHLRKRMSSRRCFLHDHGRRRFLTSARRIVLILAMIVMILVVVPNPSDCFFFMSVAHAKEIQATKEWTMLGENDTIERRWPGCSAPLFCGI